MLMRKTSENYKKEKKNKKEKEKRESRPLEQKMHGITERSMSYIECHTS